MAGVAWATLAEVIRLRAGWPIVLGHRRPAPGLAFLACGYVAWSRTPDSRPPLMIAVGFAWYAGTASTTGIYLVDHTAHAPQGYYDAFLAWLIFAYPGGHLRWSRPESWSARPSAPGRAQRLPVRGVPLTPDLDVTDTRGGRSLRR